MRLLTYLSRREMQALIKSLESTLKEVNGMNWDNGIEVNGDGGKVLVTLGELHRASTQAASQVSLSPAPCLLGFKGSSAQPPWSWAAWASRGSRISRRFRDLMSLPQCGPYEIFEGIYPVRKSLHLCWEMS